MIDEIDALIGDILLSVLRQLRAGYPERPGRFPQCVILCGVRDVRDYRIRSSAGNAIVAGGSAFNVRAESLPGLFMSAASLACRSTGISRVSRKSEATPEPGPSLHRIAT